MLDWIRTFVIVYQTLSFSTAAKYLDVAQPTVSTHIKNLEEELGTSLFSRKGRLEIIATKEADFLYPKMISLLDTLNDSFDRVQNGYDEKKDCVIACSHTVSNNIIPKVVTRLIDEFSYVKFVFQEMNSNEVMNSLHMNQANIGFLEKPLSVTNIKKEIVYKDQLIIVGEDNAKYWVLRENDSGMRFFNDLYMTERDITSSIIETNNDQISKKIILSGLGRAVVSSLYEDDYKNTTVKPYKEERNIFIAKNRNSSSPYIEKIYNRLKHLISELQGMGM